MNCLAAVPPSETGYKRKRRRTHCPPRHRPRSNHTHPPTDHADGTTYYGSFLPSFVRLFVVYSGTVPVHVSTNHKHVHQTTAFVHEDPIGDVTTSAGSPKPAESAAAAFRWSRFAVEEELLSWFLASFPAELPFFLLLPLFFVATTGTRVASVNRKADVFRKSRSDLLSPFAASEQQRSFLMFLLLVSRVVGSDILISKRH